MALFGGNNDKKEQQLTERLERYGLQNVKPEYRDYLKFMLNMDIGADLQGKSDAYLQVIKEQNWMIIRLLNDIANK